MSSIQEKKVPRGLWVPCEGTSRPLESREKMVALIERAHSLGISNLYVQVFRSGMTWFPSRFVTAAPHVDENLHHLVTIAEDRGIKVHAWMNVFNIGTTPDSSFLGQLSTKDFLLDNFSQASIANRYIDTPGTWLDPSSLSYHNLFLSLVSELFEFEPRLAGIHLDYIRYPYSVPIKPASWIEGGYDFGYSEAAMSRFFSDTGGPNEFIRGNDGGLRPPGERAAILWDEWRRQQVTSLVSKVRARVGSSHQVSCAVLPWSDRAYYNALQDWRSWASDSAVNAILLMAYSLDATLVSHFIRQARPFCEAGGVRLGAGLAAYKCKSVEELKSLEECAKTANSDEIVLFSYDHLPA